MPPESPALVRALPQLAAVQAVCDRASQLALQMLEAPLQRQNKTDHSPVTAIDLAVDALLSQELQALWPEAGWLSEETADNPRRLGQRYLWVVDPIDGTRSLLERRPEFCVSVALVDTQLGPVLGVIANPMTGEVFLAERGSGARDAAGRALQVRAQPQPRDWSFLVSRTDLKKGLWEGLLPAKPVPMGSLAYKMALVAAGAHDAHATPTPRSEWDAAAGHLILHEAGGVVSDGRGQPLRYNQPQPVYDGMVVASREAFPHALALCAQAGVRWQAALARQTGT